VIPILDLTAQYRSLKPDIDKAIADVLVSGNFIMGPNVDAFEKEIASYLGVGHAITLNSGTDALHLALRALGVGPGDEVITTPHTFVATTEAIGMVGATPVFVDIDPATYTIDPAAIGRAVTSRTRAILPVHLYGLPADLDAIVEIAQRRGIYVVEDCAQAIGAEVGGRKAGSLGHIGCFSFFPSKNLGAYGDGGMATTNDAKLAERLRALRLHGGLKKYHHDVLGVNSRLDELQAAILRVKLPHLDSWNSARRQIASRYNAAFTLLDNITTPFQPSNRSHVFHQYTIRVKQRDKVRAKLAAAGIQTMVYYPVPLHLQRVHAGLTRRAYPHAETASREVLSLPIYPELELEAQDRVISAVGKAIEMTSAA
jgi:dTDP-4-amino-4,6-dideoxygalactose transaminase